MTAARYLRVLLAPILLALPLHALAAAVPKLDAPPEGDRWFSISVGGERVGFAHMTITKAGDGYRIDSDSSVKMKVMGFSRQATSRESYLVGSDLAIRSCTTDSIVDGKPIAVKGEATPQGLRVAVDSNGKKKDQTLKAKGAIYPSQALNLYPLMRGPSRGKVYRVTMLDPEEAKTKQVKVEVVGQETLPQGTAVIHLRNNLYPMVDNDIWVDLKGNTVKESVRDDLVLTLAEDEKTAKLQLAEAVLARKDAVADYSRIPAGPAVERPEQLKKLSVELAGIPAQMPILQGKGQQGSRLPDGKVVFNMPNPSYAPSPTEAPTAAEKQASPAVPSDAPEIVAKKAEIVGDEKDHGKAVKLLVDWVAKQVKAGNATSAAETFKSGSGNTLGRARLYTALARAAGIPTRFVSGIVYSAGHGFVYHCWSESYIDGWIPVDPTFSEVPADVTHIKLVQGDSADDLAALGGVIGKVQAKVVDKGY